MLFRTGTGLEADPEPVGTSSTPGRRCVSPPPTGYSRVREPPRLNADAAGTELDTRGCPWSGCGEGENAVVPWRGEVPPDRKTAIWSDLRGEMSPPGDRRERIEATFKSCTCWCLLSTNSEVSRHCVECSHRCLMRQEGWRSLHLDTISGCTRALGGDDTYLGAALACKDGAALLAAFRYIGVVRVLEAIVRRHLVRLRVWG